MSHLCLTSGVYLALVQHLNAVYPYEGCGLLAGSWSETTAVSLYAIENIASNPRRQFLMSPQSQLAAFLEIEAAGLDLLAIYHSHPHGPETPSATDMAQAYYPELIQVIVSLASPDPVLRAFWLTPTQYREIQLLVAPAVTVQK